MTFRPAATMILAFAAAGALAFAAEKGAPTPPPLFMQKCAKCHGEDGRAQTAKGKKMKAQDFTDPDFQQHKSDDQMVEAITNGTEHDMPAFGKTLSAEEIQGLVKVVRSFSR